MDLIAVDRRRATPSFIRAVQRAGKEVHVWTVNDRAAMQRRGKMAADVSKLALGVGIETPSCGTKVQYQALPQIRSFSSIPRMGSLRLTITCRAATK